MRGMSVLIIIAVLFFGIHAPTAEAAKSIGVEQGLKSLVIPGWGQYQNGEFESKGGRVKVGVMAALEVAAIITTAVVGGVTGYPQIWVGIGLFIGNHVWSALDAFINAKEEPSVRLGTESPVEKVDVVR